MISRTALSFVRRQSAAKAKTAADGVVLRSFAASSAASLPSWISGGNVSVSRREKGPEQQFSHQFSQQQQQQRRSFSSSSSSHDDFAPVRKQKPPSEIDGAIEMIQQHVTDNPVMLYMKGNPSMPMCGFSAKMVQTLQAEGIDFSSVNVLDYPSIREGVKRFASWPTIPQLYVNGEFIGGIDIVSEMHESGELKDLLAEAKSNGESKE